MKIASLLLQYLISQGSLSLAGIGRFTFKKTNLPDESQKQQSGFSGDISFYNNPAEKIDDNFVSFISKSTGKMKSLAESDISSYTDQVREFLNIGKPFEIEGIGSLTKLKTGEIEFNQGSIVLEKTKESPVAEMENPSKIQVAEERYFDYNDILTSKKPKRNPRNKVLLSIAVLAGIGLAVWGGYSIYKNSGTAANISAADSAHEAAVPANGPDRQVPDSNNTPSLNYSTNTQGNSSASASAYKFIIKEGNLSTAWRRYNYLKNECKLDVYMGTKDSSLYKVFFRLPATPADTARITDSLNILYISPGQQKVKVEAL